MDNNAMKVIDYIPVILESPRTLNIGSAWMHIPTILKDIITRFEIWPDAALEFGTDMGFSASAFACYFKTVITVDTFSGDYDRHIEDAEHNYINTKERLSAYPNIEIVKSYYQDFIKERSGKFDLIHIDIVHTYKDTFDCGDWACEHSNVVLFHDTVSYEEVMNAVLDLSERHKMRFYNYKECNGLGILVR